MNNRVHYKAVIALTIATNIFGPASPMKHKNNADVKIDISKISSDASRKIVSFLPVPEIGRMRSLNKYFKSIVESNNFPILSAITADIKNLSPWGIQQASLASKAFLAAINNKSTKRLKLLLDDKNIVINPNTTSEAFLATIISCNTEYLNLLLNGVNKGRLTMTQNGAYETINWVIISDNKEYLKLLLACHTLLILYMQKTISEDDTFTLETLLDTIDPKNKTHQKAVKDAIKYAHCNDNETCLSLLLIHKNVAPEAKVFSSQDDINSILSSLF